MTSSPVAAPLPPMKALRGFHVGGAMVQLKGEPASLCTVPGMPPRISDPNGSAASGQVYVQQFLLAQPSMPYPVYFWHGGGMTGCTWEDTPDGRPGWADYFLRQGYDVFISDAVERGRASWPPDALAQGLPEHRTLEQAWTIFRLGTLDRSGDQTRYVPHSLQRFPVDSLAQLAKQFVPRWTVHHKQMIDGYCALLQTCGAGIIVAHSEGARLAQDVAQRMPHLVKALVLVEPAGGIPADQDKLAGLANVPVCVVWGDYVEADASWRSYRAQAGTWLDALQASGGTIRHIDLPALGIKGNSHLPMMDLNNADVAALIHDWLAAVLPAR